MNIERLRRLVEEGSVVGFSILGLITTWTQQTDSNPAKAYGLEVDAVDRLLAATLQTTDPT